MAFVGFDFIENFFFISLGITFSLIILLVYHFKERITSMERKGDTMYELITNVVKELQFMKKLNAYYETLFQQSALHVNPHASTEPTNTLLQGSVPPQSQPSVNSRIVVSDEESSVSSEESDSDDSDSDMNYSTTDVDSDEEEDDKSFVDTTSPPLEPVYTEELNEYEDISNSVDEITLSVNPESDVNEPEKVPIEFTYETPNVVSTGIPQIPVEINELMGMIQDALVSGISPQEPPKFAPYYEPETEYEGPDANHYKPVVVETDGEVDEQIIDVVAIEENTLERTSDEGYEKIESVHTTIDAVELDVNDLSYSRRDDDRSFVGELSYSRRDDDRSFVGELEGDILKNQEQEQDKPVVSSTANSGEQPSVPVPEPTDKKQTREVYRKMNITQLRGIAVAAGISTDTTKMKKNELIQLLENLEE
jgi:hypothetical protein